MKRFAEDCKKLERVIESCKTRDQFKSAWAYYNLWEKKYPPEDVPRHASILWTSTSSYCVGYIMGWLKLKV